MFDATRWRLPECRDSPGPHSSGWVPVQAGWAACGAGWPEGGSCVGSVCPMRWFMPANDSCWWQVPGVRSAAVILARPAAVMPACSQHSRQYPFLTAISRRQPAHSPQG